MKPYKVGLVGLRRGSSLVRPFELFPETEITALCDVNTTSLTEAARAFAVDDKNLFTDYTALLNSDVDIVVVGTPIQFHAAQSIQALEAGKHVLSEVTAAYTLEDCQRIVDTARRSRGVYMMGENTCYFHYIRQWKSWVQQGRLGDIFYAECEYIHNIQQLLFDDSRGESYWRLHRPPIYYCSHSLGPVLQLMNDYVVQVTCLSAGNQILNRAEAGTLDMEVALCKTAKGKVIKLLRSQVARREPPTHTYTLYGTKGFLETNGDGGHGDTTGKLYVEGEHGKQYETIRCPISDPNAPAEALMGGHGSTEYYMVRDFIDAIQANRRPPIDAVAAAQMTAPGICAHESALKGGQWIDVPTFHW